jgi:hypothetical protein
MGDFPGQPERCLILLNMTGLSDAQKGDATCDLNLFVLALLASSIFIYNTMDADALDGLHLATRIGEELLTSEEEVTLAQHFPHFVWAIRDPHLKLEIEGKPVTPNEYLQHCLKGNKKGFGPKVQSYNALRDALRNYFPNRDCFAFPPPTMDMEKMNHLDELEGCELAPEFQKATDNFVNFVINFAKPKHIMGIKLSGHGFAVMLKNFLDSLLKKQINIQSTYSFVVDAENRKALDIALASLQNLLDIELSSLPVSTDEFKRVKDKALTTSSKVFLDSCINKNEPQTQKYLAKLDELIQQELVGREQDNLKVSEQKCKAILNDLYEPIKVKMNETFMTVGGYNLLKPEINSLKMAYLERSLEDEFGPCKGKVFKEFEDEKVRV